MYDIPETQEFSGLLGKELQQVCIGNNEVIFNFDSDFSLCVMGPFEHIKSGSEVFDYTDLLTKPSSLPSLLNSSIFEVKKENNDYLLLCFQNNEKLRLINDTDQYECFSLNIDGNIILVV
ncbi:MAG: hypothetical protein AAGF53_01235 [Pseudomonadota bacterium]